VTDAPPAPGDAAEPYQSLYRRYRPQRFADVLGQEHVTRALRNAVREGRVAHAYLFSGPRGTGKTSTARILAMALNCANPQDGEPDGVCESCMAIRTGASVDVHELDAASNRRLDEMRELLSRVALGTSGRQKVYIVDEVHQLTPDASSALLKTLEEPPAHVVFVLATTDPQRVLPTIRSRTQHYEFRLLPADTLTGLLADVNQRAGLGLPAEALDLVVRRGRGSARDALSVLDQVAAAGGVEDESSAVTDIVDAIAGRDAGRVLLGVAEALGVGRDPRRLTVDLIEHLRNGFLASQSRSLVLLADDAAEDAEAQAHRLGLPTLVRAIEELGQAAVDMRDAVDPRVTLEAALVRLASPDADKSPAALLARIERLEAALAAGAGGGVAGGGVAGGGAAGGGAAGGGAAGGGAAGGGAVGSAVVAGAPAGVRAPAAGPAPAPGPAPMAGSTAAGAAPAPGAGPVPAEWSPGRPPAVPDAAGPGAPGSPPRPAPPRRAPGGPPGPPPPAPAPAPGGRRPPAGPPGSSPPRQGGDGPSAPLRGTIGALRGQRRGAPPPEPAVPGPAQPASASDRRPGPTETPADRPLPTRDELTQAWGDRVLATLSTPVRPYFSQGRFVAVEDGRAVFALPDQGLLSRAQLRVGEAEAALSAAFGRRVPLRLVLDEAAGARPPEPPQEEPGDLEAEDFASFEDAGPAVVSPEQRLLQAFPGAEEVES
jgi:DNA polymerase-3 subunit gamma/tau